MTLTEAARKEKEEAEREAERVAKASHRAEETRQIVIDQIKAEAEEASKVEEDGDRPDDTDDVDEAAEYLAWKMREVMRIKRDVEKKKAREAEESETERRRNMTAAERAADDRRLAALGLKVFEKEKTKIKFMQKYYHKGAFYMDEESMDADDVRKRNYNEATLEDKFNKAALPKVMQVKKFGKIGNTKYTHLKDQDTTSRDSPWMDSNNDLLRKMEAKKGGIHTDIDVAGKVIRKKRDEEL